MYALSFSSKITELKTKDSQRFTSKVIYLKLKKKYK